MVAWQIGSSQLEWSNQFRSNSEKWEREILNDNVEWASYFSNRPNLAIYLRCESLCFATVYCLYAAGGKLAADKIRQF